MSFRQLYERYWPDFEEYWRAQPDLSPPLLIDPPDKYSAQPIKLFVVGQETRSWYNSEVRAATKADVIDRLMHIYKNIFRLGLHRNKENRSAFWEFVRKLERRLGIIPGEIIWSNVNKVDEKKRRPSREVRRNVRRLFPVLAAEIELTAPDIVLFLTGPDYDDYLRECFPGLQFQDVGGATAPLMVLRQDRLPAKSYRTHHPRLLRQHSQWKNVLRILQQMCADEKGA